MRSWGFAKVKTRSAARNRGLGVDLLCPKAWRNCENWCKAGMFFYSEMVRRLFFIGIILAFCYLKTHENTNISVFVKLKWRRDILKGRSPMWDIILLSAVFKFYSFMATAKEALCI